MDRTADNIEKYKMAKKATKRAMSQSHGVDLRASTNI
jgi:hypothetical protein